MMDRAGAVARIRSFNRFYTNILGLLNRHILDSDLSLTEARVLLGDQQNRPLRRPTHWANG